MDNIAITEESQLPPVVETPPPAKQELLLTDVVIADENVALNVIVSFVNIAQRRGAYSIAESAKIFECVKMFMKTEDAAAAPTSA